FGDKNHKAFSRFCLCGHEKSGLVLCLPRAIARSTQPWLIQPEVSNDVAELAAARMAVTSIGR
ncbi:hypothetical protein, partial [Pseudomonas sp. Y5-11]|uniref:hypothetical protein n=1 Tax=Pseudomonas sp. Y5-11 TaxID=2749808 RepID=UPI001EFBA96E